MKLKSMFRTILCMMLIQVFLLTGASLYADSTPTLDRTQRLAALAKTWGLLKYYHPEVAKGEIDWDAVLINAVPIFKADQDFDSFNQAVNSLILEAGDVNKADYNPGTPAQPNEDLFKWIKNKNVFSKEVRKKLTTLQKKHVPGPNHYVYYNPVGTPNFSNENPHPDALQADENFRLLTLFRYWNIIQYFSPYKDEIGADWEEVLEDFIPRFVETADPSQYHLLILELVASINDGHGYTFGLYQNYYWGYYNPPFEVQFIENRTVVTRVFHNLLETGDQVKLGDIILKIDDEDIETLREQNRKYIAASNDAARDHRLAEYLLKSPANRLPFTISRNGQTREIDVPGYFGYRIYEETQALESQMDRWKILPGNIGYVHMGILESADLDAAFAELMGTRAIIFDIRNYPNFILYDLAKYLNDREAAFVKMVGPDPDAPGSFLSGSSITCGENNPDYYRGRVVVLVNEETMSRAEFIAMALQTAPDVTVIGSRTAGADGNIVMLYLPGRVLTYFSGLGVYYPNGAPTQGIGIVPDIHIRPTIAGVAAGQDEVLQRAVDFIEGE